MPPRSPVQALPPAAKQLLERHGHFGRRETVDPNDARYPMRAALRPRAVAAAPLTKAWRLPRTLFVDQGDTPWCVDATRVHWERALPICNRRGLVLGEGYHQAKLLDGAPTEEGTDWRTMMKVLQAEGEVETYVWAQTFDDIVDFLRTRGPVALGANWTESMFTPGRGGLLTVTGPFRYGHEVLLRKVDVRRQLLWGPQSWGLGWGDRGEFCLTFDGGRALFENGGDACGTVERMRPVPTPLLTHGIPTAG